MIRDLRGHFWTIAPSLVYRVKRARGLPACASQEWVGSVADALRGQVVLRGRFHPTPGARDLVVVVHGLAGGADSFYMLPTAEAAVQAGCAALRMNLRGADRSGEDLYHGGLTADFHAVVADPRFASYERVFFLGYSMGGHAVLNFAAETTDPRVGAVAAICAPLDLGRTQRHMDRSRAFAYRRWIMDGLRDIYQAVYRRHGGPLTPEETRKIRTFEEWDDRLVAPRYGFANAQEYYDRVSAWRALPHLRVKSLLLLERRDPMLPEKTFGPHLGQPHPNLDLEWMDCGGHVGFPRTAACSLVGDGTIEELAVRWLLTAG